MNHTVSKVTWWLVRTEPLVHQAGKYPPPFPSVDHISRFIQNQIRTCRIRLTSLQDPGQQEGIPWPVPRNKLSSAVCIRSPSRSLAPCSVLYVVLYLQGSLAALQGHFKRTTNSVRIRLRGMYCRGYTVLLYCTSDPELWG